MGIMKLLNNISSINNDRTRWQKIGWLVILLLITLFLFLYIFEKGEAAERSIATITQEVLAHNPQLKAAEENHNALAKKITDIGALPDPMLTLGSKDEQTVGIKQTFNGPGMISAEVEAAKQDAAIASLNYEILRRDIVREAKEIYYQLYATDQALRIVAREKAVMQTMYHAALRRYETGSVTQQDPLKANLAIVELTAKLYTLQQQRDSLLAQLRRLAGGTTMEIATIDTIDLPAFPADLLLAKDSTLLENPEILTAASEKQKALAEKDAVNLYNLPEFELGAEYSKAMGNTDTMVGISLPLWLNKNEAKYSAQDALLKAANANYEAMLLAKEYELQDLYYKIKAAQDTLRLYKEIYLPQTRQVFAIAKAAYATGKIYFLDWLTAETKVLEAQMKYYDQEAMLGMLLANVETLTGKDLSQEK